MCLDLLSTRGLLVKRPGSTASLGLSLLSWGGPASNRAWLSEQAHPLPADLGLGAEEASSLAICPEKAGTGRKKLLPTCVSLVFHGSSG